MEALVFSPCSPCTLWLNGFSRAIVLLAAVLGAAPLAVADGWSTDWDGTLYGYANTRQLRSDSVLNPDNRFAHLAERSATAELRFNLQAESDAIRLTARPIVSLRRSDDGQTLHTDSDAWLSQWQLRVRAAEGWHIAAGRDLLNWGPAQFRSPSSPFYFDNVRRDPLRELTGIDSLKVSWTPDRQTSLNLVRIVRPGHAPNQADAANDGWRNGWLAKSDRRGDAWAVGLVAARSARQSNFFGAHAQATLSDALLLYGEANSARLARALQSPADVAQPFSVQKLSARRTTLLLGASYTFENGQSLAAEYLRNGHGYTAAQEDAYFARALASPPSYTSAGLALSRQAPLLGRDYLHLVWQSNLLESDGYWRLMVSRSLTDGSGELAAYGEKAINGRVAAYLLAVVPHGNARQEFSALFRNSVTLGVKIALP